MSDRLARKTAAALRLLAAAATRVAERVHPPEPEPQRGVVSVAELLRRQRLADERQAALRAAFATPPANHLETR